MRGMLVLNAVNARISHCGTVTEMAWRPVGRNGARELTSCGDDCSVRMYEVYLNGNRIP